MRNDPATVDRHPQLAGEVPGVWDGSPLDALARELAALEAARRRVLDRFRDVSAWGGTAQTTGLTQSEWLTLVGRLSSRDAYRLERMTSRLSALPITASLLASGKLTVDQAAQICDGTTRLSGTKLAEVDRLAAEHAADRNTRGDAPDIDVEVDRLVEERRKTRDVEAAERRAIEGSRVFEQQDFDGGGRITADLDASAYPTVSAAINAAAGTPSPEVSRANQRAEGLVALADAWMAGGAGDEGRRAKPSITLTIDLADATPSTFAQVWRSSAGRHAPHLSARLTDVIACTADVHLLVADGGQPLSELTDQHSVATSVRRAVLHRDRGCRFPRCTAPPWHADVHHIRHRAQGGDHAVNNLLTLCRRHHTRLHGPHWTVRLDPVTAAVTFSRRRDGTRPVHTTFPHGIHPSRASSPPEVASSR